MIFSVPIVIMCFSLSLYFFIIHYVATICHCVSIRQSIYTCKCEEREREGQIFRWIFAKMDRLYMTLQFFPPRQTLRSFTFCWPVRGVWPAHWMLPQNGLSVSQIDGPSVNGDGSQLIDKTDRSCPGFWWLNWWFYHVLPVLFDIIIYFRVMVLLTDGSQVAVIMTQDRCLDEGEMDITEMVDDGTVPLLFVEVMHGPIVGLEIHPYLPPYLVSSCFHILIRIIWSHFFVNMTHVSPIRQDMYIGSSMDRFVFLWEAKSPLTFTCARGCFSFSTLELIQISIHGHGSFCLKREARPAKTNRIDVLYDCQMYCKYIYIYYM